MPTRYQQFIHESFHMDFVVVQWIAPINLDQPERTIIRTSALNLPPHDAQEIGHGITRSLVCGSFGIGCGRARYHRVEDPVRLDQRRLSLTMVLDLAILRRARTLR